MKNSYLILLLLISVVASAKNLDMLNLTNNNGLSNSSINKIFQDSEKLIWFGTWDGLNVYNGRNFKTFKPEAGNPNSISNNIIRDIIEENKNILWITTDRGISRFDKTTCQFNRFFTDINNNSVFNENSFFVSKNSHNRIFAAIYEQGIYYFNDKTQSFIRLDVPNKIRIKKICFDLDDNLWILTAEKTLCKAIFKKGNFETPILERIIGFTHLQNIESVFCETKNKLWMQTTGGKLFLYCISEGILTDYSSTFSFSGVINAFISQNDFQLWGTTNGLFRHNLKTHKTEQLYNNVSVLSLCAGTQNIIWVGTDAQGVFQLFPIREKFRAFTDKDLPTFGRSAVRTFYEDKSGTLWIGTKGSGIYALQPINGSKKMVVKQNLTTKNGLLSNSVFTIVQGIENEFWIGTDGNGINYSNRNAIHTLSCENLFKEKANLKSVYSILFTDRNTMWVGTSGNGMYKLLIDRSTNPYSIKSYKKYVYNSNQPLSLSNNVVYSIIRADENKLWVGTRGGGINLFDITKEQFETFRFSNNNPDLISSDDILSLHKDKNGFLWIGTSMGLIKLEKNLKKKPVFTLFTEKEGMPNNTIHGILEDRANNLWLSTNKGLAKLIQQGKSPRIISYFQNDGLQNNEFADGAFYESPDHTFYFGGISGFNAFNPLEISNNQFMPSMVLDAFYVDNTETNLSKFIKKEKENHPVEIPYQIKSFSFKFMPIDYISSTKCEISYMLAGFQKDWINLGTSNTIVFSNLPKGNYTLKVRCTNADKIWSDELYSLPIIVQPPWWANNVAYVCYTILFLIITYLVGKVVSNHIETRNNIRMKELEKQKTEEIHQAKLRFFTNIAHEFSNSLTLIYGPCIQLLKNIPSDVYVRKQINTIKSNAERMQNLIQQLIEFRKVETDHLKPKIRKVDIIELVEYVTDNFTDILEEKNILLKLSFNKEKISWDTDWDYIEKIIFNLLSNAVKYTPAYKSIELRVSADENNLTIIMKNHGVGIKADLIKGVFNRFEVLERLEYQTSNGLETRNGIGLALCKSLTEILNGSINLESDGENYTQFTVTIPLNNVVSIELQNKPDMAIVEPKSDEEKQNATKSQKHILPDPKKEGLILIIDDDIEIRLLISELLSNKYEISEAGNGREAIEIMKQRLPILVICDIIMPEMNGIDFVKLIKKQELTRHIPIILLSTRASVESQIEGLEVGADAYLGKPFHPRHLEALTDSLLQQKKAVIEFSESVYASMKQFDGKLIKKEDNDLILKITKLVSERIDEESLTIESIATEMAMSKMQLYRKIKETLNETPTEFIRNIRLNHAEKLLKSTNKTVQEIMYECGFNNKTYFYREFSKKFQKTPKEYRNQI